jgi:hypothetical protein
MNSKTTETSIRFRSGSDGDASLCSIIEQIVMADEARAKLGLAAASNDLDARLNGIEGEFKSNLIVSLACSRG